MIIEYKCEGYYIRYAIDGSKITFRNNELTLNLEELEQDYDIDIDVFLTYDNKIVDKYSENARLYIAQIEIPARRYNLIGDEENGYQNIPVPFDMSLCKLILWGLNDIYE